MKLVSRFLLILVATPALAGQVIVNQGLSSADTFALRISWPGSMNGRSGCASSSHQVAGGAAGQLRSGGRCRSGISLR